MSPEDFLYLGILLVSIPIGHGVKLCGSPARKQLLCTAVGLALTMCLLGTGIWHSLAAIFGTYIIVVVLGPRYVLISHKMFILKYDL